MPGESQRIAQLLAGLVPAQDFEAAATLFLRELLLLAQDRFEQTPSLSTGRILRAVAHVRRGDSYRSLIAQEASAPSSRPDSEGSGLVPSASAWQWIARHHLPVSIDVLLGTVLLHGPDGVHKLASSLSEGRETRQRLLGRSATHVFVLPMRVPGDGVAGMIAIEAQFLAIGVDVNWEVLRQTAQLLVDVATPYLCQLPARQVPLPAADANLPVVGGRMAPLIEMVRVFARQPETLLLSGPTGAGKSRLARWCHEQSPQHGGPFECLSLLAVPEELQLAELFGWKRGAFTGAVKDTDGYLTRANGGTLFIDEIDKLSLRAQAALLRVAEERTFRPLGDGAVERRAEARFIVGTNIDLSAAVRAGTFREDLYYRINVLPFRVPGLEERSDEIGSWARFMLSRKHTETGAAGRAVLDSSAEQRLSAERWPGNLRQLDNIIRRAYAIAAEDKPRPSGDLTLLERHIDSALSYEPQRPRNLVHLLLMAAESFANELEQRQPRGLDLDLAEAFRGIVLAVAVKKFGRDEAFRRLGKESLVAGRNHHKTYRRELDRVRLLHAELGLPAPQHFPFELEED